MTYQETLNRFSHALAEHGFPTPTGGCTHILEEAGKLDPIGVDAYWIDFLDKLILEDELPPEALDWEWEDEKGIAYIPTP